MKPEDFRASTQRPFTGEEYLKKPAGWSRDLYLWRASERRHYSSGIS